MRPLHIVSSKIVNVKKLLICAKWLHVKQETRCYRKQLAQKLVRCTLNVSFSDVHHV